MKAIYELVHATTPLLLTIALSVAMVSCKENLTDDTQFNLYYYSLTDIAPSMSYTLVAPSYIGSEPSGFEIYNTTLDGMEYTTDSFSINESTGAITISNSDNLSVGTYLLSISCDSNRKHYTFPDLVSVNMLKGVPDGITVEPSTLRISLADIVAREELETAQVTTDGNHISISSYAISNVRRDGTAVANDGLFEISSDGEISVITGNSDFVAGVYSLDIKLNTAVADAASEEGLFTDALTVDVTSLPVSVTYTSSSVRVEQNASHTSSVPTVVGSADNLTFAIKSLTPSDAPITIDSSTGVISLAADNGLEIGTVCTVDLTLTNDYGSTDFENAYQITIVDYIAPITYVTYTDCTTMEGVAFTSAAPQTDGDEVTYSFGTLVCALDGQVSIDATTGVITAESSHSIPQGTYSVPVVATNDKGSLETALSLIVEENPYYFSYVSWGNNLGLTPQTSYASQFRGNYGDADITVEIASTDIPSELFNQGMVTFSASRMLSGSDITVASDGTLTITFFTTDQLICSVYFITVTVGAGQTGETSRVIPVFVQTVPTTGVIPLYTPFVFQVNSRTGGTSAIPDFSRGTAIDSNFMLDYRRTASFYNLNGPESHIDGAVASSNTERFMSRLWSYYYLTLKGGTSVNYGAKAPMSYYENSSDVSKALAYTDPTDYTFVVNPNYWILDGYWANGIWRGQFTYTTDGSTNSLSSGTQIFPLVIWFDTDF